MRVNNQTGSLPDGGFTVPAIVADSQAGTISTNVTFTPDVTPTSGKQVHSYTISSACTLGALTGTSSMAADTAMGGSIFLAFTGSYTVTINSAYKFPSGVSNSIAGTNGETWRIDFLYRKTANRCSAVMVKEAT